MYANFAYMQNLRTYANLAMCTHLLTYAKFACMQKLENLHLPQTKCKSHFAYTQNLRICKSGHVNSSVGNRKGKSLLIIGKLLPIDYRLIIENPSIA